MGVLEELIAMGFDEALCRQAVVKDPTLEGAMEYVLQRTAAADEGVSEEGAALPAATDHEMTDASEGKDESAAEGAEATPAAAPSAPTAKSWKCLDTGKVFRTMTDVQLYAEKTGNSNFEECDVEIAPLTAEEKQKKVEELRAKIKRKAKERAENEKLEEIQREKARRKGGQGMGEIRDDLERRQRELEYAARKKEKADFKAHKERLRIEVAKDKAERAANRAEREGRDRKKAYDEAYAKALGKSAGEESAGIGGGVVVKSSPARMDTSIERLKQYRAGGDGERALKTLSKLVSNALQNPDDPKYRRINLANEAIKKRVASLIGGVEFLKACGFKKIEAEKIMLLEDDSYSKETLELAKSKLEAALK